ncbi:MAG: glycosyl hydrolase [Haliscomenobacter sp.]|nr:glycosyl hydrolase [Haliscomenobacter sp.]
MKKQVVVLFASLLALSPLLGQKKTAKSVAAPAPAAAAAPAPDLGAFKAMRWRNIGPFRGGRSNAVSGIPGNDQVYYVGYTGGGLWKTMDAGLNWTNISDGQFKTSSVGDIAVSEADPNVIYVGMGEHAVRGVMTSYGDGVYKSTDAGKTWKNIGLPKSRHITDIAIHPENPDVVWVGVQGALHGASEERGVYKSTDGGQTWKRTLYVDENTGVSSLSMDFNNPRILYAATWQHRRYPWKVESGGPGSAIWKSVDGGETWKKSTEGLPALMGKSGVSVSRANPNRVFAIVEAERGKAGLYRSDDAGARWTLLSTNNDLISRSWYYMEVFADPKNAEIVYVLNAPMMRSIDGGRTFNNIRVGHGDTHDLWISPSNSDNMILGDDGGAEVTFNSGQTWSTQRNQPTAQFYRVNTDNLFPYRVYGGQQDNTSVVISSRTNGGGITESDWFVGPGCESAFVAFDPNNPVLLYGGCYQGQIDVLDTRTKESKDIRAYPALNLAYQPKDMKYRFNWNAPIVASPHDPSVIYHAGNVLFKTTNGGMSWEVISPDLTRNDTTKQGLSGGPFTNEGAGGENYNTIDYVIESPLEKGVIYTGSGCGLVHLTRDGGKTWTNVTPAGLPECMVHSIEVSPHDPGTAYIAATRYKFNDMSALSYKTMDYGKTWTKIANGIDPEDFLKVIREDKKVKGLLYGGAEHGFYISFNGGASWQRFQLNFPVVPVTDLKIQNNDLVASTAGRSFWILDDLSPIQESMGQFAEAKAKLFSTPPTVRAGGGGFGRAMSAVGENPPGGIVLRYYLKEKADTNLLKLDILDAGGKTIRSFTNKKDEAFQAYPGGPPAPALLPSNAGINQFVWDLRTETSPGVSGVFVYGDHRGYQVAPGAYRIRLQYLGETMETVAELTSDPRTTSSKTDWDAQQALLDRISANIKGIHESVNAMRKVKKQIETYNESMKGIPGFEELVTMGQDLIKKIDAWESNLVEARSKNGQDVINWPNRLNADFFDLRSSLDTQDPRITQGIRDRMADLESEWTKQQNALAELKSKDMAAFNQAFKAKNIPALIVLERP